MMSTLRASVLTAVFAVLFATVASAQTGMIKGKVVDPKGQPVVAAKITIEFTGGVNRKMETKTDKKGEFIQIGLQSGAYRITASDDKLGSQAYPAQVRVGQTAEVNFVLGAGGGTGENPKAAELKKLFEEGVAASRGSQHDVAIEKFTAAAQIVPNCHDCYYNIGYAYLQKKDEKQAEGAWLKALELKPDYSEALNALATLYNNQKRFDEASAMSAKAASAGGGGGGGNADAIYNQGIILWNQGKIPEAKAKFEEALKANPSHPEANFQFGMALLNEGNIPEAIAGFEKYLSLAPEGQFAGQAKAMLAQLKK